MVSSMSSGTGIGPGILKFISIYSPERLLKTSTNTGKIIVSNIK